MLRFGLRVCVLFLSLLSLANAAVAGTEEVTARASCAIVGMTSEQARYLALQRARTAAIEQAAGVSISAAAMVTDGRLAGDFIKSFSQGYIVAESVVWEPAGQYQPDPSMPPIIEYRVRLTADVFVPDEKRPALGLRATLNQSIFRADKDKLTVALSAVAPSRIAVFNLTADDQVVMLYPEPGKPLRIGHGRQAVLPDAREGSLLVSTLKGHKRDTEALLVAALPDDAGYRWEDAFAAGRPMSLTSFFKQYATFAPHCEDVIVPYEVFSE